MTNLGKKHPNASESHPLDVEGQESVVGDQAMPADAEESVPGSTDPESPITEGVVVPSACYLRVIRGGRDRITVRPPIVCSALHQAQDPEGHALLEALAGARELGLYVTGLPGTGKSTTLLHLVLDDMHAGRGCAVIDPHGDLINEILARSPADGRTAERVLLFDPADTEWPIPLNILEETSERAQDLAVQFMIDLYEALFLRDQQGPVLHQSLRNGIRLAMQTRGSLAEVPLLFADRDFLQSCLRECTDPWVRHYFANVWLKMSDSSRGEYLAYFTSKLSGFFDDRILRNILGQRGGMALGPFLEGGGILLANLARGAIGDLNARLLGMLLLHLLERATLERHARPPEGRPPLHIYIDEFHEFATRSLIDFLGAARKFNVGLTLAHQRLEMLHPAIREAVLGTVGHALLFRQGSAEASELAALLWPRFGGRELVRLPNFQAVGRAIGPEGRIRVGRLRIPLPGRGNPESGVRIREASRRQFGRPRAEVERALLDRLGWNKREG